jgi:hypothetical protein
MHRRSKRCDPQHNQQIYWSSCYEMRGPWKWDGKPRVAFIGPVALNHVKHPPEGSSAVLF